jgi:hypothetical protein
MSDNDGDKKQSEDCRESKARRNWWYKAKRFVIRDSGMYDVGDNAKLKLSENNINAGIMMMADRLTIYTSHVNQGETNGLYDNYQRLRCSPI